MPQRFFVICYKYSSLCSARTKKKFGQMLLHEREATRNQDFLQFGCFLSLNLSKKQQDPKFLFECQNHGPRRLLNCSKRSMGTACWREINEMIFWKKKLCFVTLVHHYEIQQPDLMTENYFLKSRMILLP